MYGDRHRPDHPKPRPLAESSALGPACQGCDKDARKQQMHPRPGTVSHVQNLQEALVRQHCAVQSHGLRSSENLNHLMIQQWNTFYSTFTLRIIQLLNNRYGKTRIHLKELCACGRESPELAPKGPLRPLPPWTWSCLVTRFSHEDLATVMLFRF